MVAPTSVQTSLEKAEELTTAILVAVKRDDWTAATAFEAQRRFVIAALDGHPDLVTNTGREILKRIAASNEQIKAHVGQRHEEIGLLLSIFDKSREIRNK